ncbi:MAG TPA: hypothetical protein VHC49_10685 [Mycobacteriales bacterium]|nr:hypothetical protein [Mycobacteriales bacterium]
MTGIIRRAAVLAAGIGAAGTLAFAGQASAATPSREATPAASWHFIDSYFWGSTCNDIGTRGMDNGDWSAYECRDGGTFSDYNLWVLY